MNNKITFPRLATMLADQSGRSKRFSETFLREFFTLITERLEAGESVKIKGFGTFRLSRVEPRKSVDVTTGQPMEIAGHSKVVFVPAKELAEAVNSPFEAFTAIEISDDIDIDKIDDSDLVFAKETTEAESEISLLSESHTETEPIVESEPIVETEPLTEAEPIVGAKPSEELTEEESTEEEQESEISESEDTADDNAGTVAYTEEDDEEEIEPRRNNTWRRLWISLGAAMVAVIATLVIWYYFDADSFNDKFRYALASHKANETEKTADIIIAEDPADVSAIIDSSETANIDSTETEVKAGQEDVAPTAPSDAVVYDTIGTTRYLTTMAKSHYGNYNLWPYIYKENEAKLGHPDRIRPGTPVVIPKLSKYGVDPSNKADIEKAKKMGVEIYARYGKSI